MQRKRWGDLSPTQQRLIIVLGSLQLSLLVAALWDIYRRPVEEINGGKGVWVAASLVSIVGPLAYFRFGRKRQA